LMPGRRYLSHHEQSHNVTITVTEASTDHYLINDLCRTWKYTPPRLHMLC
jgi:hypothetical protein